MFRTLGFSNRLGEGVRKMPEPAMAEFACPYAIDPRQRQVHGKIHYWVGGQGVTVVVCPWLEKGSCKSVSTDKTERCFVKGGGE